MPRTMNAAGTAATIGAVNGTQEYSTNSEDPFPRMGSTACASRGPKSRAGFIAVPVGPPAPTICKDKA